jgi:hypothetical protein
VDYPSNSTELDGLSVRVIKTLTSGNPVAIPEDAEDTGIDIDEEWSLDQELSKLPLDEASIPTSLNQIYEISNSNRAKNKRRVVVSKSGACGSDDPPAAQQRGSPSSGDV